MRKLQFFISSPGDVCEERALASRVIERLQSEYMGRVALETVLWEHEPLVATSTFQVQLVKPSETDVVISILWSRLGTRLPAQFTRDDGSRYESGTEYEFEEAMAGFRKNGKPDLLVYRRTAPPSVRLDDEQDLMERLSQKKKLDEFIDKWFHDQHRGHPGRGLSSVRVAERLRDPAGKSSAPPDRAAAAAQRRAHHRGARRLEEGLAVPRPRRVRVRARAGFLRPHARGLGHPAGAARAGDRGPLVRADPRHERRRQIVSRARRRTADADQAGRDRRRRLLAPRSVPADRCSRRHLRRARAGRCCARTRCLRSTGTARGRTSSRRSCANRRRRQLRCCAMRSRARSSGGQSERPPRAGHRSDGGDVHAGRTSCRSTAKRSSTVLDAFARSGRVWVICTLRSDFYPRLAELPETRPR